MSFEVFDDIDRGDGRTVTAIFTIPGGDPTNPADRRDPTVADATLRDPDGIETIPTLAHPSTGVFTTNLAFSKSLSYWLRIRGTGAVTAVSIVEMRVRDDVFST